MIRHACYTAALAAAAALLTLPAAAHRLIPNEADHSGPGQAIYLDAPDVSQVIYHALAPDRPTVWLAFDAEAGQEVYAQLGVPYLDRLSGYLPAIALVGPGLPSADLPFGLPDGAGAVVLRAAERTPEFFDEHFTGTQSWIYVSETVTVPEAGRCFLVLYHPRGEDGKAWMATGRKEQWGLADILTYSDVLATVRTFHEVEDEPLPLLPRALNGLSRLMRFILSPFGPGG